jgi:hypothetical protein
LRCGTAQAVGPWRWRHLVEVEEEAAQGTLVGSGHVFVEEGLQ